MRGKTLGRAVKKEWGKGKRDRKKESGKAIRGKAKEDIAVNTRKSQKEKKKSIFNQKSKGRSGFKESLPQ